MSTRIAKPEHEAAYSDICSLVSKHAAQVSAAELLAIASNMLGKLIAMQDQRTMSHDRAMEIVIKNIEVGNQQALQQINECKGSA